MEVCALSGDQHQLHDFVDRFKDQVSPFMSQWQQPLLLPPSLMVMCWLPLQGFAEVLYKHYLEEGERSPRVVVWCDHVCALTL